MPQGASEGQQREVCEWVIHDCVQHAGWPVLESLEITIAAKGLVVGRVDSIIDDRIRFQNREGGLTIQPTSHCPDFWNVQRSIFPTAHPQECFSLCNPNPRLESRSQTLILAQNAPADHLATQWLVCGARSQDPIRRDRQAPPTPSEDQDSEVQLAWRVAKSHLL